MFAALLKKQLMELGSFYTVNKKTGARRFGRSLYGMIALVVLLLFSFGALFYGVAESFGAIFLAEDTANYVFYFAFLGLTAVVAGTIGSAFTTYSFLFCAKDNDLLLSMPIPPFLILVSRTVPVYLSSFLYAGCAWVPTVIVFWQYTAASAATIVLPVILWVILSLFVTVLSCLLGWLVALITARMKNKTLFTTVFTLVFIFGYYFLVARAENVFAGILLHSTEIGNKIKIFAFPVYALANAACGDLFWFFLFTLMCVLLFGVLFLVLSKTFIRITTASRGAKKSVYREKAQSVRSTDKALLSNEFRRLFSNSTYLLNCGLGIVFLLIGAIVIPIKGAAFRELVSGAGDELSFLLSLLPALLVGLSALLTGMNVDAACSVSLEGKSLWIVRSFPIESGAVLRAKRNMHLILNLPAVTVFLLASGLTFGLSPVVLLLTLLCGWTAVFAQTSAEQILNLRHPNFTWTTVAMVAKQSTAVALSILVAFATAAIVPLLASLLLKFVPIEALLALGAAIYLAVWYLFRRYIVTRGVKLFENM